MQKVTIDAFCTSIFVQMLNICVLAVHCNVLPVHNTPLKLHNSGQLCDSLFCRCSVILTAGSRVLDLRNSRLIRAGTEPESEQFGAGGGNSVRVLLSRVTFGPDGSDTTVSHW